MNLRKLVCIAALLVALLVVAASSQASAASALLNTHDRYSIISPRANSYRSRRTLMPFNYYSIPVCKPSKEAMKEDKNKEDLGEILTGNRLVPTLFQFNVTQDVACVELCRANFSYKDVRRATYLLENNYDARMFLDGVPLVSPKSTSATATTYQQGYAVGPRKTKVSKKGKANLEWEIYNHLQFTIAYDEDSTNGITITGFSVAPMSIEHAENCTAEVFSTGNAYKSMMLPPTVKKSGVEIRYTYSVQWEKKPEGYSIAHSVADETQKRGHKIAALYGVLLTVLAGVVVASVMLRTIRKDLAVYLDEEMDETELREESGWKLVRGDVFRPPPYAVVLATLVGAGCQITATIFSTMLLCSVGAVDPAIRGHFLTTTLVVFLFTHVISGFATSRLLKLFGMATWKTAMLCMAAFPLSLGGGVLTLNFIHWMKHTTAAIPFGTIIGMAFAWLLVSLPIGALGVLLGFRMDTLAVTAKVSSIPRLIPAEAGSKTMYYLLFGSFVPFVACCVEMSYVLNAFWREERMYMYGLLTFFLCTMGVLCVEVGIVVTYFTLRDEDYRWWWRSFAALAATGVYVFFYSIFYLKRFLQIRLFWSIVLFLSYMLGVSAMFGLALGTISFLGSFWMVQHMYAAIKAD